MAGIALVPEAAPFIKAGDDFAKQQFGQPSNSERRDGYGQDPGNGDWCQDEGGLLICLPSAGGVYYQSGGGVTAPIM